MNYNVEEIPTKTFVTRVGPKIGPTPSHININNYNVGIDKKNGQ